MSDWERWEDYQAGLYDRDMDEERQRDAAVLLADPDRFREAAKEMIRSWPFAAIHNLERMPHSRNAWVGQATCRYSVGATSADTKVAWGTLTNAEQRAANEVAIGVRESWDKERRDGAQTLFDD
jgi:hypothetical protein